MVTSTVRMLKMSLRDTKFKALWVSLEGKLAAFLLDRRCLSEATSRSAHLIQSESSEFRESRSVSHCGSKAKQAQETGVDVWLWPGLEAPARLSLDMCLCFL